MNYPTVENVPHIENWAIINHQPVTVSPEATFLEVLRKFDQGCDCLIVVDCHIPLGVITIERVIKIITTGVNIYSLRARNFCQSFPCQKETELIDVFTIAQGIFQGKYDVYGCLNERDNFNGYINAKSLIRYLVTDSYIKELP